MSVDLGYVAGIIDARAHIDVARTRISVTTRREDLLRWLADRTGVGVSLDDRPYTRRACSVHCQDRHQHVSRQSAYWTVRGMRAAVVLDACLPWLVQTRPDAFALIRNEVACPTWPSRPELTEIGAAMKRLGWPLPQAQLTASGTRQP